MRVRGFTLIEVVVCIAIVAIVAALTFPAFQSARLAAKQTDVKGQLRQLHTAVTLYRTDYDGFGKYGQGIEIGLPPTASIGRKDYRHVALRPYGATEQLWIGRCEFHRSILGKDFHRTTGGGTHWIRWNDRDAESKRPTVWEEDVIVYRENSALIINVHCNRPATDVRNLYEIKTGIAVLLSGSVVQRSRRGEVNSSGFYADPQP
jgi:prepilin-type N-terminal cleavage/methylation domain-containing protein